MCSRAGRVAVSECPLILTGLLGTVYWAPTGHWALGVAGALRKAGGSWGRQRP